VVVFGQRIASRMNQLGKNGALVSKSEAVLGERVMLDREAAWLEKVQSQNISRGRFWGRVGLSIEIKVTLKK